MPNVFLQDYATNAWELYAAHVMQCHSSSCTQCELLNGEFNRAYVAEQREHDRLVAVNNYKDRHKSYDIRELWVA